jgi:argininosuccinate synthase
MNANDLRGKTIAFAASGGLDSCTITHWLANQGVNVVCFSADLGQPDESDFNAIEKRMVESGASAFVGIDLKNEMAEMGLSLVQANAKYEGNYWNMTGAARQVITRGIISKLRDFDIDIFSHGATGRGNDQVRFQVIASMLNPNLKYYAAWRDGQFLSEFKGRSAMLAYCEKHNIPVKASKDKPYSTDANLLGLTHEGGALESLQTPMQFVTPGLGNWPVDAPDEPRLIKISYLNGRPIEVDGQREGLVQIFRYLNQLGGWHGIGIAENLVENRFVGVKSRGVYESPALNILGYCYQQLMQQLLDKRALQYYLQAGLYLGTQLYQGYWVDLGSRMARQSIAEVSKLATGTVTIQIYKGNVSYVATEKVKHGLYNMEGSMEDEGSFDHKDSEGLLNILTLSAKTAAKAGQIG